MSGIYVHIPFCRQACHYCDFHFSTSMGMKDDLLFALLKEIEIRKDYLKSDEMVCSIYFGGGTPSILSAEEINEIIDRIKSVFSVDDKCEITLEANPDDLSEQKLNELKSTPVNRLSIGIQSFSEDDLAFMNRVHHAEDAIRCVEQAKKAGFKNISVDLIYGTPGLSDEQWKKNLEQVAKLDVQHLSCYSLTIEPGTPLAFLVKKGKARPTNDEQSARQFEMLGEWAEKNNFIHYEISNLSKTGFESFHNSNYWKGAKYAGFGPSAHSFDGSSRQWNIANNARYIQLISENKIPFEKETLTENQKFNEYVMTSLRTMKGCDMEFVRQKFGEQVASDLLTNAEQFIQSGIIIQKENNISLSPEGKLLADGIASDLFIAEEN